MSKKDFVNPFEVSYDEFLKAIPKDVKIKDYLKGKLSESQIEIIEIEIEIFNKLNKK